MSDYTRIYNFTIKDGLPSGDPSKVIKGTELDVELNAVANAVASKSDSNSPTFTGTPLAPTASYGTSTTQLATTAFVQAALQAIYPVGSVYINAAVNTNPSTLLGFGTWVSVGDGKVLVNQNTSDTDFDVLGETGGSKSSVAAHTHTYSSTSSVESNDHYHAFTTNSAGDHSHTLFSVVAGGNNFANAGSYTGGVGTTSTAGAHVHSGNTLGMNASHTHSVSGTTASTGTSNGNLQPYVVVKMWKRTA